MKKAAANRTVRKKKNDSHFFYWFDIFRCGYIKYFKGIGLYWKRYNGKMKVQKNAG